MSVKKSDLQKGIEKFDAEIAKHQQEIVSLEAGKAILEGVLREKNQKKSKKAAPVVRGKRATRAAAAGNGKPATDADTLFEQTSQQA